MSVWLAAAAAGLVLAALSYARRSSPALGPRLALAVLRALAVTLLAALALDAPAGRSRAPSAVVALDVSASWTRGGDVDAFRRARDVARALGGDTLWAIGDSARPLRGDDAPHDARSSIASLAERAAASGRVLQLVTDGEIDDAAALRGVARGSRVRVESPRRGPDAAVTSIDATRLAAATDTIDVRVSLAADAAGAAPGTLRVDVAGRSSAQTSVAPLPAFGERTVSMRLPLAGLAGSVPLRAVIAAAGDREPRNDTLATTLDVSAAPAAVFVSSAPDFDARGMLAVLRGALSLPTRAYLRVAPGQWRVEGTLAPVDEAEVRRVALSAGVLVLHGDTAVFGAPRAATRGALLLFPTAPAAPGAAPAAEWYASDAPASPAAAALSGVAWDSLPPLDLGGGALAGAEFDVLRARLARSGAPRAVIVGAEQPRRVIVVGATGFWRWQFRGGAAADAFTGLWGGILDFLAAGRGDVRGAVVADAVVRAGEPIRWRRGGADSLVTAVLRRRGAASADTVRLHFGTRGEPVTSAPLAPGTYDVTVPGGGALLVVNVARELLPRRATVASGPVGSGRAADLTPRLRDFGLLYALALALLCAEWLLRRRWGLR
ncbi:hypothetical protein J421_3082 [Gemmatirosa kalamazoonensis]|uniref:Aerotolerance regulator N-terminal domain-containing protein n=1 Tax=Gemmatirosa kalamazoonensis TaxID=861299 RepID=W0RHM5_9BACT|nr:hypothetical protein [Gemmatirosa kalamazoonensis]AHG90619.1 hypothetical protein J421_3082 [Gemmatirosa kalamazoonensis]